MRPIDLVERKQISLNILNVFDAFCVQNNIHYSLGYGSLLGAIRHGGFIPWDDDIDIIMLREDYQKFEKLFPPVLNDNYTFFTINRDPRWYLPFGKVCDNRTLLIEKGVEIEQVGVNIDIFPLDYVPNNFFKFSINRFFFKVLCYLSRIKILKIRRNAKLSNIIIVLIAKSCLFFVANRSIIKLINKLSTKSKRRTNNVYYWPSTGLSKPIPITWFSQLTTVTFEGKEYSAISDTHGYLQAVYGADYMIPPPENERVSFHVNEAFWIV